MSTTEQLRFPMRYGHLAALKQFSLVAILMLASGCGGGSSSSPPPPPQAIAVTVSSSSSSVLLGNTLQFTATVTGTSNTNASWTVTSSSGENTGVGTIDSSGLYTAPGDMPSPASVTVTGTSQADPTKSASKMVTITSDIAIRVQVNPATAVVETGSTLALTATLQSGGRPDTGVTWSINGIHGGNNTIGTISTANNDTATYTAPAAAPFPATVTIEAVSVADKSRSSSAIATVMAPTPSVLVASGQADVVTGWTDTAEVYDLASATWKPSQNAIPNPPPSNVGGLCAPNTAVLGNGKVLLAGGGCSDKGITTNAASLYDPTTNQWTATSPMAYGRDQFGMIALSDGNAMAIAGCAGGCEGPNAQGQFFTTVSKSAEIYDAQTGTWSTKASLNTIHGNFTWNNQLQGSVQLQDGRVLACGGSDANVTTLATCEIYDPKANSWTTTGALTQPCSDGICPLVVLPNGNVLTITSDGLGSAIFNPGQGTWQAAAALTAKQIGGTLTVLGDGEVLLTGGGTSINNPVNGPPISPISVAEIYDPAAGSWRLTAPMTASRAQHVAILLSNGKVLVAGGYGATAAILSSAEIFDPSTETWSSTASMMLARAVPGVVGLGTRVSTGVVSALIPVGNNPQQAIITPSGAEMYVTNHDDNTVSVISVATNSVSTTVTVGGSPASAAVSPGGSKVYVGNNAGSVSIIDTTTKAVTTIATAGPVRQLAITPDGSKVYLAMENAGLWQLMTATNSLSQVSSLTCPEGVAVAPNGSTLYVNYQCFGPGGSPGHDAIGIFSVSTNALVGSITGLPNVGEAASISPNGAQVWEVGGDACSSPAYDHVGCPATPGVPESVVNVVGTMSNTLIRSFGGIGGPYISFSPDSTLVFLVSGNTLQVVDTTNFTVLNTVAIPASGSVAYTPDRTHAYAPLPSKNLVAVLLTSSL